MRQKSKPQWLALLSVPLVAMITIIALSSLVACSSAETRPAAEVAQESSPEISQPTTTPEPTATPAPSATPTATLEPTFTPEPTATPQPTATPAPTVPSPDFVNGVPVDQIIVLPDEVVENVRRIYAQGRARGRDPHAFSKLGDSLIATPSFLAMFETNPFNLGPYDYLAPVLDYYSGSFERYGVALRPGLHAWGVFDPLWANKDWCQANENLLDCEIRLNNPSVMLVLLGTNDVGYPEGFDFNMRKIVQHIIDAGIIPVIVTKADRFEGPDNTNNNILRTIAADMQVPLWDYDLVAETLPNRGLQEDGVHLTVFPENDYTMPEAYQHGHGVHNLTALMMLDAIRQIVSS
ncbi:MAG: hypothetical protein PVJ75_12655 [Chloroflexota bacterium]